jgi:hypothetical protein
LNIFNCSRRGISFSKPYIKVKSVCVILFHPLSVDVLNPTPSSSSGPPGPPQLSQTNTTGPTAVAKTRPQGPARAASPQGKNAWCIPVPLAVPCCLGPRSSKPKGNDHRQADQHHGYTSMPPLPATAQGGQSGFSEETRALAPGPLKDQSKAPKTKTCSTDTSMMVGTSATSMAKQVPTTILQVGMSYSPIIFPPPVPLPLL